MKLPGESRLAARAAVVREGGVRGGVSGAVRVRSKMEGEAPAGVKILNWPVVVEGLLPGREWVGVPGSATANGTMNMKKWQEKLSQQRVQLPYCRQ